MRRPWPTRGCCAMKKKYIVLNDRMIRTNKELEGMLKEAVLVSFYVLSTHFLGMTKEPTKNLDFVFPGRNTKQTPAEYK
jgi:hypothetical protein